MHSGDSGGGERNSSGDLPLCELSGIECKVNSKYGGFLYDISSH